MPILQRARRSVVVSISPCADEAFRASYGVTREWQRFKRATYTSSVFAARRPVAVRLAIS